jgi:transposase
VSDVHHRFGFHGAPSNHSREFKLQVVGQINTGLHTTAQLRREHSLAPTLIHRWRKEVEDRGEAAFTDGARTDRSAELRTLELERYCGQLVLKNSILRTQPGATYVEHVAFHLTTRRASGISDKQQEATVISTPFKTCIISFAPSAH